MSTEPKLTQSERGFNHAEPIATSYGHEIRIYESSSADGPKVWIDIAQTEETMKKARTNIAPESATALLTLGQVHELIATLAVVLVNHYQLND